METLAVLAAIGLIYWGRKMNSTDVDTVARTLWGEARSEGAEGMQAVANVIMNRVRDKRWPSTPAAVATQKWQFSAWNHNDPNRAKLLAVTESDPAFAMALRIAEQAVSGSLADITNGATHYHTRSISVYWAKNATLSAALGSHLFYTNVA